MMVSLLFLAIILHQGLIVLSYNPGALDTQATIKNLEAVDTKAEAMSDTNSTPYAFSADLLSTTKIAPGSTIVFDRVMTNVGGLYFNTSGQFACPDQGLYVFLWSIWQPSNENVGMQCITTLRQGGTDQKDGPKTSYYSTSNSGITQMMAVLPCITSPPTAVTVASVQWSETVPISVYHAESMFSGFKLSSSIAFTVKLSQNQYVFDGGRIMFDQVLTNSGGYYDDINGFFKCPDDGVYVFGVSWCIMCEHVQTQQD